MLVLFDLVVVGGVEQQLLNVCRLQSVGAQVHQDLPQLVGGQFQVGDEDGCREGEEEEDEWEGRSGGFLAQFLNLLKRNTVLLLCRDKPSYLL